MLYFPQTRIMLSIDQPVYTGQTITAEGCALVSIIDSSGGFGVQASAGTSNEAFAGISISQQLTPLYLPSVEVHTAVAGTFTLNYLPSSAANVYALDQTNSTAQTIVTSGTPTANQLKVIIATGVCTTYSGQATDTYYVTYRYSPTTVQAQALQGQIPAGGGASAFLNRVGTITQGVVFTTEFDTSVTWTSTSVLKTGAGGLITNTGSGSVIPGYVVQFPTTTVPYLGFYFGI